MTPEQKQAIQTINDLIQAHFPPTDMFREPEPEPDIPARVAHLLPGLSQEFIHRAIALSSKNEDARIAERFRVAIAAAHQAFSASPDEEAQP